LIKTIEKTNNELKSVIIINEKYVNKIIYDIYKTILYANMIRLKTLNWISYVNKETRGLRKLDN
jgi:hypothetical protein